MIAYAKGHPIKATFWGKRTTFLYRGRLAMAGLYQSYDQVAFDKRDCTKAWPWPADILSSGPIRLRVLLDQLGEDQRQDIAGPIACWFLTLPGVLVTGLNASYERIEIDAQALIDGKIGRHDDSIVGGHGQLRWHVVAAESRTQPGSNAAAPAVSPSGRAANDDAIKAWMESHQRSLKQKGLKHGRDVVLKATMEKFSVSRKAVFAIWSSGAAQRKSGRPKTA